MQLRGWFLVIGALAGGVALSACGAKTVVVPAVTAPRYPEFVRATVPVEMSASPAAAAEERAWRFLQSGDLDAAERETAAALLATPAFYPADITRGYVDVARRRGDEAIVYFDRALALRPEEKAAFVGRGHALLVLHRDEEALDAFTTALAQDPTLADVGRRVEVLRLQVVQQRVALARNAVREGDFTEAREVYRDAIGRSPESGFLHHELADVERDHGDGDQAIVHYRRAAELDAGDVDALVDLAEMLDARNDFEGAMRAYDEALAAGAPIELTAKRDALRLRAEVAGLPVEYRAIESTPQLTRSDLAALIGFRLPALLQGATRRDIGVVTDVRGHWAESWMLAVAGAGFMDVFDNHTFQPRTVVRRVDFAQVVTRLLNRLAELAPAEAASWRNARGDFSDLVSTHLAYPAASIAVASGVMTLAGPREFQPNRIVTGADAVESIRRLRALVDLVPGGVRRQ